MRTRIALAAAATAVLSIGISTTALAGDASGAPTRQARPTHSADREPGGISPTSTGSVPGFLAPALSALHHRDARRQARDHRTSPATLPRARATTAHTHQMMRVIDAWRATHPVAPPAPAPASTPPPPVTDATSTTTPDWACIRLHESGDRYNTPAAPGGAYGFLEATWLSLGYGGWPYEAPAAVQDQAVLFLYNELGWQPWSTRFVCGL